MAAIVVPLTEVPALESRPGAPIDLYLNFKGDITAVWGGFNPGATPAFDVDSDPTTFSETEISDIEDIFARVADKFSPFNINVTTTQPSNLSHGRALEAVVGGTGQWE